MKPRTQLVVTIILVAFTIVVFVPFLMMLMMSFKNTTEIIISPLGLPEVLRWDNYTELFLNPRIRFHRFFINSVIVTVGAEVLVLTLASLAGYGFSRRRFSFRFRNAIFVLIMMSLMLPMQAMYLPQYRLMSQYGLTNSRIGLILLYGAYQLAISTFLIRSYFQQLPEELEESARLDGAGDFLIFRKIMLPIARPVIVSVMLLAFVFFWNELLLALTMVTKTGMRTIPLAMMYFVGETGADYGTAAASLVVALIPVLILYSVLAEKFLTGMAAGALKG